MFSLVTKYGRRVSKPRSYSPAIDDHKSCISKTIADKTQKTPSEQQSTKRVGGSNRSKHTTQTIMKLAVLEFSIFKIQDDREKLIQL